MDTYPQNTRDFERRFCDNEACLRYIFDLRWPDGYQCPYCGSHGTFWQRKGLAKIRCGKCRHDYSITSGTIFQDSHISIQTWFRVMWHICLQKNGISALGIQRSLGLPSYQTAWLCLHKLRKAMIRQGRNRLSGKVEVDEAYIGGVREGKRGRGADGKQIVFFALENKDMIVDGKKRLSIGRIRLLCIPNVTAESLLAAVEETVETGSHIITDGLKSYAKLKQKGYAHTVLVDSKQTANTPFGESTYVADDSKLPKVHLVVSLLKRWILGTFQGSVGKDHLQDYLNEFTFRFNRRASHSRGMLFWRLAQMAVTYEPTTKNELFVSRHHI